MEIGPILAALRRNRIGAILIGLQVALTLAIVCNALFIIHVRLDRMGRPSGIDEDNVLSINNFWVTQPDDLKAREQRDLTALRGLPDVVDAFATANLPLGNSGWGTGINLALDQKKESANVAVYYTNEHALNTLGIRLVSGRWFTPEDITDRGRGDQSIPPIIIVTRALAEKLFPAGDAVGKTVYMDDHSTNIIGVIERMQVPWVLDAGESVENSVLMPGEYVSRGSLYVLRAKPGRSAVVLQAAQKLLRDIDTQRMIGAHQTRLFSEVRAEAYSSDRALTFILAVVCALLVVVTALGIVGLTSYWVSQRRRQIGIRRALGATRTDILRYFQTENLLIGSGGALLGVMAAVGLNIWLVTRFEMTRISPLYVVLAAVIVLVLGQLAVLGPAMRAARVPPVTATRGA